MPLRYDSPMDAPMATAPVEHTTRNRRHDMESSDGTSHEPEHIPENAEETDGGYCRGPAYGETVKPIAASGFIVSPAIRSERKRLENMEREKAEKRSNTTLRRLFAGWLLSLAKRTLFSLLELYQTTEEKYRAGEWGGAGDFTTKYTDKELYYLAISLPQNIRTAEDILGIMPFMGRKHRYRLMDIKRNQLKMYRKIFEKR